MLEMYTIKEVAEMLKISEGTVRNYLSSGNQLYCVRLPQVFLAL